MREEVLGILCSGSGTNLQSIINAVNKGEIKAKIAVVIVDNRQAYAAKRAKDAGIDSVCVEFADFVKDKSSRGRDRFEQAIVDELKKAGVTLVVLAGFMKILGHTFLNEYGGRTLNIHPALLPSFKGAHAHRDALNYGVKVSGCTVHFIDEGMDSGPIIMQAAVPVLDDDTEETLAARVLQEEHRIYPQVIKLYCEGKLQAEGRRVKIAK